MPDGLARVAAGRASRRGWAVRPADSRLRPSNSSSWRRARGPVRTERWERAPDRGRGKGQTMDGSFGEAGLWEGAGSVSQPCPRCWAEMVYESDEGSEQAA